MQMNQRFLQRFGEPPPFGDTIARAALRDDPDAPYGELATGDNEGQRLFEQPDVEPSRNRDSMVAVTEPPMDLRQAAMPPPHSAVPSDSEQFGQVRPGSRWSGWQVEPPSPSAPMENPIVRAGRERAELVLDPYLDYDSETPIRAQQSSQPPPEMVPGMVGVSQPQLRMPPAPPQFNAPAPPPENPVRRYQRELDELKAPERGPVSKWAKLAAVALGAGQGYYNAANPNAKPIDASEAVQNLTFGRKYLDAMGEYQRKRKDIGERLDAAGKAENIESNIAFREGTVADRKAALARQIKVDEQADKDRDKALALSNFRLSLDLATQGFKTVVDPTVPAAQGVIRFPNPMDPTGKGFVEGMPTKGLFTVTDPDMARQLNGNVGMEIPWTMLEKLIGFRQAVAVATIQAGSRQPATLNADVILLDEAKAPGTHAPALVTEARRQRNENHRPPAAPQSFGDGDYNPKQLAALTRLNEQVSKNANVVRTNSMKNYAATVLSGLSQKTGVGDIAAINQFQKLIDEGAVTRDQDVRLIQGSQNLLNKLKTQISNLSSGQQLSPDLRQQMITASNAMYEVQRKVQANDPYFISKIKEAKRYGLNLEDTILGGMGDQAAPNPNAGPGRGGGGSLPPGWSSKVK